MNTRLRCDANHLDAADVVFHKQLRSRDQQITIDVGDCRFVLCKNEYGKRIPVGLNGYSSVP